MMKALRYVIINVKRVYVTGWPGHQKRISGLHPVLSSLILTVLSIKLWKCVLNFQFTGASILRLILTLYLPFQLSFHAEIDATFNINSMCVCVDVFVPVNYFERMPFLGFFVPR